MIRRGWDQTWLDVAATMARRSPCVRRQIGAVIVSSTNRVIATGYNGPPAKHQNTSCLTGCPRNLQSDPSIDYDNCISIHAEANALMFCDRREREGGRLYVTEAPCFSCAKLVSNSGLVSVAIATLDDQEHRPVKMSIQFMQMSGLAVQVGPSR